jgi:hypothetical protein
MSELWEEADIQLLRFGVADGLSIKEMAVSLGRSDKAIRNKCWRLGLLESREWTEDQIQMIRDEYATEKPVRIDRLEELTGKTRAAIFLKASRIGLGDRNRKVVEFRKEYPNKFDTKEELSAFHSERQKKALAENGHPRGMLGKSHSESTKAALSSICTEWNRSLTDEKRIEYLIKGTKTKMANGTYAPPRKNCTWKAAWHEIGGKRKYYRSKWESNYAYYLESLKVNGEIKDWTHESKVFWFEGIKRGCVSYLPDFHVIQNDGSDEYHEVKGWMDAKSVTKIKRMAKYHPDVKLIVIDSKAYTALQKQVSATVPGWQK